MAEALGAASSIVTLVETARKVFEYIKAVKDAPKDVNKLTSELQLLIDVLQILQAAKLTPDVHNLLESPLHQCLQELNSLHDKLPMRTGIKGALDRLKWPMKEGEVKIHINQFERFKGLFTLALAVDNKELMRKFEPQLAEMLSTMQSFKREQEQRQKSEDSRRSGEKRDKLLRWISAEDFDARHRETLSRRADGTGKWIEQALELQRWIRGDHDGRLLWGKGDPGAGKTFLCSVVIDHLHALARTSNYAVACFYFTYDNQDQQRLHNVLAAVATQLLIYRPHLFRDVESWYDKLEESMKKTRPTGQLLETMIHHALKAFSQAFFVFDALDECNENARTECLSFLSRMRSQGVNFFVISRPHLEDLNEALVDATTLQLSAHREDLKIYIEKTISKNKRAKYLFQDPSRREKVVSVLTKCANGMFQLVYLFLDELCFHRTVGDMIRALDELEHSTGHGTYGAIYDKTIQRLQDQPRPDKDLAMTTLVWLVQARRPLTIDELRIAVSVRPGIYKLSDDDLPSGDSLVDVCGGLVTMDETSGMVRLVHSTVQEHLLRRPDLIQQDMDFLVLESCITYLSFDVFKQRHCTTYTNWRELSNLHPFLKYATKYWLPLVSTCREDLSADIIHKFLRCPEAVSLCLQAGHIGTLARFLTKGNRAYTRLLRERFPLHTACAIGHGAVVQRLLDEGEGLEVVDDTGVMPLHIAVQKQNEAVVRLLLERGAAVSVPDGKGQRPLYLAIRTGNEKIVAMLLNFGADVLAQAKDGRTILHEAASHMDDPEIVRLLLERGAVVSAQDDKGYTPFHVAAKARNRKVVTVLLQFGASFSAQDKNGWTPLHLAVLSSNSPEIVHLLLEKDADSSVPDGKGRTPLHLAVQARSWGAVRVLLQFGAKIPAYDTGDTTPLDNTLSKYNVSETIQLLRKQFGGEFPAKYDDILLDDDNNWSDRCTSGD